jgi:D-beta-D-heptose 7-phosphate kinase/D-beta-D-heptose 1-phosphate adenosyltransferase
MSKNKIKTIAGLRAIIAPMKRRGKKIVFTNGCFDILHKGHIKLFKKAKKLGDILIVAINSDSSVKKIKGPGRPVNPARDRALVLSAIDCIDFITVFSEADPARIIKKLDPDILVKGSDWGKGGIIGSEYVKSRGGKVVRVPLAKGYSTTRIIAGITKCRR